MKKPAKRLTRQIEIPIPGHRPTLDDVKKKPSGAIHSYAKKGKFWGPGDAVVDERMCLGLSRSWNGVWNGVEREFVQVYRHPCGEVVMSVPQGVCITLDTLVSEVVPMMKDFDAFLDIRLAAPKTSLSRAMGLAGGIGCSLGGCDTCRPILDATPVARKPTRKGKRAK